MQNVRCEFPAVLLDGFIYAVGGQDEKSVNKTVERYNVETNTWEFVAELKEGRHWHAACAYKGKLYAISNWSKSTSVEQYDPIANEWSHAERMRLNRDRKGRWGLSCAVL